MSITQYLTQKATDKRLAAKVVLEVADSINVDHAKFTKRTFNHDHASKYNDSYWGAMLSVWYEETRDNGYKGHEYLRVHLKDIATKREYTPVEIKSQLVVIADGFMESSRKLEIEVKTLASKRTRLVELQKEYNAIVDSLTPWARDALGVQHDYNSRIEDN